MGSQPVSLTKKPTVLAERGCETTRHLCAGVYRDRTFRTKVVREILGAPGRRVAPSYGFDLVTVAHHARRTRNLDHAQHVLVWTVLGVTCALSLPIMLAAVGVLTLWGLTPWTLRNASEVLSLKARTSVDRWLHRFMTLGVARESNRLRRQEQHLKLGVAGCGLAVIVPVVSAAATRTPLSSVLLWSTVPLVLLAGVVAASAVFRHRSIVGTQASPPPRPTTLTGRLAAIQRQEDHPVVVYRRPQPKKDGEDKDDLPLLNDRDGKPEFFVGSGKLVHRWTPPLTVQLLWPPDDNVLDNSQDRQSLTQREHATPPFRAHQLVEHLRAVMEPIGRPDDPAKLAGFRVRDRIYVAETNAGAHRHLLNGPISRASLRKIIDEPYSAAHHFLEMSTTSSGELVTTVFLRVTIKGRALSLDLATCALTRTPDDYQRFSHRTRGGAGPCARFALDRMRRLPGEVLRSLELLASPAAIVPAIRAWTGPGSTEAPSLSIREDAAVDWGLATYDKPTILDQMKIIEQRLLTAAEDFLWAHDVDTSEFTERAQTIISASVLNMGGQIEITGSAIGDSAQLNQNTPMPEGANQ